MKKSRIYFERSKHKGAAILISIIFFLVISLTFVFAFSTLVAHSIQTAATNELSAKSYLLADEALKDVVYRLNAGKTVSSGTTFTSVDGTAVTTITNTSTGKQLITTATVNNYTRKLQADLALGTGVAFHYGVQAGVGGFDLQNSSSVTGNIHSDGPVTGASNYIYGDVVSASSTGLVDGIHATGTVYAHIIRNSTINKDAYYSTSSNNSIAGISYPNSPDQGTVDLPISDAQISEWETEAAAGGTISSPCPYTISSNTTLGPIKIACDLTIKGVGTQVTLNGHVWVTGNITTSNSPTVKISSSLGSQNVAFIADNPANKSASGRVFLQNNTTFQGSGSTGSYVFIISQNNSAETGGSTDAISVTQGTGALVAYASHGQITLGNSISLKEITAYKTILQNSANITYDTGLPSVLFSAGPSGGYSVLDWKEIP